MQESVGFAAEGRVGALSAAHRHNAAEALTSLPASPFGVSSNRILPAYNAAEA